MMQRKQGAYGALFFWSCIDDLWPGVANTMGSASCIDHTGDHHCVGAVSYTHLTLPTICSV